MSSATPSNASAGLQEFTGTAKESPETPSLAAMRPTPPVLTPTSVTFGSIQVGSTSAAGTVSALNPNHHTLTAAFTVSGPFSIVSGASCPASIAICPIKVTFTPAAVGAAAAVLRVTDAATGLSNLAALSGTGTPLPAPILSLSASSLNFMPTTVGTTVAAQPATLINTGNSLLDLSLVVITGTNASDFTQTNTCLVPLSPGASCTLSVLFSPSASGTRTASLQIGSNVSVTPTTLLLIGSGTAVSTNALIPGANAVLPFSEGAGSVARDTSGNGNDCTFGSGSNSPTWRNKGLQFSDNSDFYQKFCTLPASTSNADQSVMNSRTLTMCAYFNPITAPTGMDYAAVFGGSTRLDIGALWLSGAAHPRSAYYMGDYFGYGGEPTYTSQPLVGYHCITYALGSATDGTLDHFYIDDTEVSPYGAQGRVWDFRAPGDFYAVGAVPWDTSAYLWATVYYVLAYPSQLTAAGVAHNFPVLQQDAFYSRGVGALPVQSTTSANVLVTNGDSLTNESPDGVTPYPYLLSLNVPFVVTDTAVAGKLMETEVADSPLIDLPLYSPHPTFALISNAAGINDINVGGSSQAQIIAARTIVYASYKNTGFTVLVPTMPSSIRADAEVQAINSAMRTLAAVNGYFLVDWANEPCLGASGAFANPTGCSFFSTDGLHLSQPGENEMARLYSNVVNYLTGSTQANPSPVTAAIYAIAPADRFILAEGSASQTLALPSCYGWSTTTPFTITNANPRGTVSIAPTGGFTLNSGTSSVNIAPTATVQVYADILSSTQSGCAWHTK